jgi:hypothetical protein
MSVMKEGCRLCCGVDCAMPQHNLHPSFPKIESKGSYVFGAILGNYPLSPYIPYIVGHYRHIEIERT